MVLSVVGLSCNYAKEKKAKAKALKNKKKKEAQNGLLN